MPLPKSSQAAHQGTRSSGESPGPARLGFWGSVCPAICPWPLSPCSLPSPRGAPPGRSAAASRPPWDTQHASRRLQELLAAGVLPSLCGTVSCSPKLLAIPEKRAGRRVQAVPGRVGAPVPGARAAPRGRSVPRPRPVRLRGLHLSRERAGRVLRAPVRVPRVGVRDLRRQHLRRPRKV